MFSLLVAVTVILAQSQQLVAAILLLYLLYFCRDSSSWLTVIYWEHACTLENTETLTDQTAFVLLSTTVSGDTTEKRLEFIKGLCNVERYVEAAAFCSLPRKVHTLRYEDLPI